MPEHPNSFQARDTLKVGDREHTIFRLEALQSKYDVARLPFSLKVLLENLLRTEGNGSVTADDIEKLARWDAKAEPSEEIAFTPARVVMQDFTGVPAVVDLAAMRDAMADLGGDAAKINPLVPAELVIDHSVQVDVFGTRDAFTLNAEREFERNHERYSFLRWGQDALDGFAVVPPDTGIVHQVNLEYLARVVFVDDDGNAYPDTLVGTDSHTTMINGLGVLGWGVGGIEAEAAMLGQPMSMLIPQVLGFKLHGELPEGATATDLVLTVTELLRKKGVVGKFVEFYGPGVSRLPLADRATIGNMSPEFGSTCAIFPIDAETLRYLAFSGRSKELIELVEAYAKEQGLWHDEHAEEPTYSDTVELDLGDVVPSLAGPKRPQDRVSLHGAKDAFRAALADLVGDDAEEDVANSPRRGGGRDLPGLRPAGRQRAGPRSARRARVGAGRRRRDGDRRALRHRGRGHDGRRDVQGRPRARRHRRHHLVHEHLQPVGHARRRAAGPQRRRARADAPAVGQDVAGPGLQGGDRVPGPRRPHRAARAARLQPRGLRLHDVHRQLRAAARRDQRGGQRGRPRGLLGAERQPQLRGAHQPRREDELPRVAAARGRLRDRRHDGPRPRRRPARSRRRRPRGLPQGPLALGQGGRADRRGGRAVGHVPQELRRGLRRRRALERPGRPHGRPLRLGRGLHLRAPAALLRGPAARARRRCRTSRARACWPSWATR